MLPQRLRRDLEASGERFGNVYGYEDEQPCGVVFVAPLGLKEAPDSEDAAASSTESDNLGSAAGYAQPLDEHSNEMRALARRFAGRARLDGGITAYPHSRRHVLAW